MSTRREQLGAILNAEVKKILAIMQELEESGQTVLRGGIAAELTDAKKKAMMTEIKKSAVIADNKVKEWLVPAISGIYVSGVNYADILIKKFGIKVGKDVVTVEVLKTAPDMQPHLQAVNALMSDAYLDFGSGMTGWVKGNEHILNDVIRQQMQSKIALGRLTGEGVREVKKEITSLLEKRGLQSLIDRGGKEWTLERYSEMLTRTQLIKANNEATLMRGAEFEIDTYEISTHGATDSLCEPQEGKIYSRTGKSKKYPKLTPQNEPPFHPNCKHSLIPRPDLDNQ